jgi:hypothetical protein
MPPEYNSSAPLSLSSEHLISDQGTDNYHFTFFLKSSHLSFATVYFLPVQSSFTRNQYWYNFNQSKKQHINVDAMNNLSKLILVTLAILAMIVSASPVAQDQGIQEIQPIETKIPKKKVYHGKDPNRLPVPTTIPATPSPRYTAPIKIVSDL